MKFYKLTVTISVLVVSTSANSALIERLGGLAYYDDVANLTWLADANYAQSSGYATSGNMSWATANSWAQGLSVDGITGWRLATPDASCSGSIYDCTTSEMGSLFFGALENTAGSLTNTGPFSNIQVGFYWLDTVYPYNTNLAYIFDMSNGSQSIYGKSGYYYSAWAVQSGDVGSVPVPAAVWLFGSGIIGLIGFAKRKKA